MCEWPANCAARSPACTSDENPVSFRLLVVVAVGAVVAVAVQVETSKSLLAAPSLPAAASFASSPWAPAILFKHLVALSPSLVLSFTLDSCLSDGSCNRELANCTIRSVSPLRRCPTDAVVSGWCSSTWRPANANALEFG